jgi:hypothetical protein
MEIKKMKLSKNYEILREGVRIAKQIKSLNYDDIVLLANIDRLAKRYHRLCENYCNGEIGEEHFDKYSNFLQDNIKKNMKLFSFSCSVSFQNDPRGAEVRLQHDDRTNHGTYCIYPFNSF